MRFRVGFERDFQREGRKDMIVWIAQAKEENK